MATTNLENQLHSAQKNLLFLQREHTSTLKGLHAEIRRLQQHCTGTGAPVGSGDQGGGQSQACQGCRAKQDLSSSSSHTGWRKSCAG